MDRYLNFNDLAANEEDYFIELEDRGSSVTVVAPHGGEIEPHSADIARLICADDYNLFCFIGIKSSNNRDLHITSHRFDHPGALALVQRSAIVIAVHGCIRKDCVVLLGGKAISVNKQTAWLVFSPAFGVATAGTWFDYAPAAAP